MQQQQTSSTTTTAASAADKSTDRNQLRTAPAAVAADEQDHLCVEMAAGRKRVYRSIEGTEQGQRWEGFDMVEGHHTAKEGFRALVHSYLLPQGFPNSVAPEYATYMMWRGVQYFFGGAISVFTTQSLLGALGVTGRYSGEAAAAINWVLKDGAGRLGRLLFARWGRELDCELKQFRLMGDLLMEGGAALELSTAFMPRAFLPLACTANLMKNLAAVAASSTRAPIYRTFALQNNLADVTAKGESVANLADILGTVAGIMLSRSGMPLGRSFCLLSIGYLIASRKEVDSVRLPYLNRARLAYSTRHFLSSGVVPGIEEANTNEPLLPWGSYNQGRVVLGATVQEACKGPQELKDALAQYGDRQYMLTYRPEVDKVFVLLREGAKTEDILKAAFSANVFLHLRDNLQLASASATTTTTTSIHEELAPPSAVQFIDGGGGGSSRPTQGGGRRSSPAHGSSQHAPDSGASPALFMDDAHGIHSSSRGGSGGHTVGAVAHGIGGGGSSSSASPPTMVSTGSHRHGASSSAAIREQGAPRLRTTSEPASEHLSEGGSLRCSAAAGVAVLDGVRPEASGPSVMEAYILSHRGSVAYDLDRAGFLVEDAFPGFLEQAEGLGWRLQQTMLNPRENRLVRSMVPLASE
ncbi:MAG: hypothetical protein WDW36_002919 [Sanguina aurantia]